MAGSPKTRNCERLPGRDSFPIRGPLKTHEVKTATDRRLGTHHGEILSLSDAGSVLRERFVAPSAREKRDVLCMEMGAESGPMR